MLSFLSALGTPIARRVEIWRPDFNGGGLALQAGFCEVAGVLTDTGASLGSGEGSVGRCRLTGLPGMSTDLGSEPGPAGHIHGLTALAVLPVLSDGRFVAAVALYF